MTNPYLIVGTTSTVTLALGAVSGFLIAKRLLEPQYVEIAEQEIEEAKEYYSRLYKKDEFSDPVELVKTQELTKLVETLEYVSDIPATTPADLELDLLLQEIERAKEHMHPHLISREEYLGNESEYTQITLTYFEEDDVLVDSDDSMIGEIEDVIGIGQLSRFGMLSGDNNIMYVRNARQEVEFEVVRNKGNYAKDVLGFIEHADHNRVRKFRRDYE